MNALSLTVLLTPEGRLIVRLERASEWFTAEVPFEPVDALADMLLALRRSRPSSSLVRAVSDALGQVVFAGAVGRAFLDTFAEDPHLQVLFACDPRLADWPWELARAPESGLMPVLEGVSWVRLSGAPLADGEYSRRGVLALPGEARARHLESLQAATRPLGRKLGVDVFPLEPVTGPALRRTLERSGLFMHLEVDATDEGVLLDDGYVPLDRLGLSPHLWLLVLGGGEVSSPLVARARALGVGTVIAWQLPLEPAAAAAFVRELYRGLATGASIAESVQRARRALVRFVGPDAAGWAAPVLWSAPAANLANVPALLPFPPPDAVAARREPGVALLGASGSERDAASASAESWSTPNVVSATRSHAWPQPVAAFVHETIRAIREVGVSAELNARVSTLRALGGHTMLTETGPGELSPAERTRWLADRLVTALGHPDEPLGLPTSRDTLDLGVEAAAALAGVPRAEARRLALALLTGPAVLITGYDAPTRARLVEAVAAVLYDHAVTVLPAGPAHLWLDEALLSNWRREDVDTLQFQATPARRMPVVAGNPVAGYEVRAGVWVLAHAIDADDLTALSRLALGLERLEHVTRRADGRAQRVPVPQDFRFVVSAETRPTSWPASYAHVALGLRPEASDAASLRLRWDELRRARFRPIADADELQQAQAIGELLCEVYSTLTLIHPLPRRAFDGAFLAATCLSGTTLEVVDLACESTVPGTFHGASVEARRRAAGLLEERGLVRTARLVDLDP
jgi:hypothetical protein